MKKVLLFSLFISGSIGSQAQNRISFELGEGWASLKHGLYSGINYKSASDPELSFGFSYLRRMNRNIYLGTRLYFQQYAFSYTVFQTDSVKLTAGEIDNKSSYFFVAPTVDIGIDRRQILHGYLSVGYGSYIHGTQKNHTYVYTSGGPFNDNSFRTDNEINKSVTSVNIGLIEHIRLDDYWHLTFNESYTISQGSVTSLDNPINGTLSVNPHYFNMQIGIMYKFVFTGWQTRYIEED